MSAPTDIHGLHIGSLSALLPIFKYWQKLNVVWENGDAPWWYNERTSVGVLAGALWKYGDWVLEEFGAPKLIGPKKNRYTGFCDIAFGVHGQDCWGEAKQCWPTLNGKNSVQMVSTNLERASKEVRSGRERGYKGLAIVFVTPKVKVSKANQEQIDSYIKNYVDQLKTILNITLVWIFPAPARYLYPDNDHWSSYYFPGVIMALRPAK
jgi:hypothetical protein